MNDPQFLHRLHPDSAQTLWNIAVLYFLTGWVNKYYQIIILADSNPFRANFRRDIYRYFRECEY